MHARSAESFDGADDDRALTEMSRYVLELLEPSAIPEAATLERVHAVASSPSQNESEPAKAQEDIRSEPWKPLGAGADGKELLPSSAQLGKLRRNARDRRRSKFKKESIREGRRIVKGLELQKQQLMKQTALTGAFDGDTRLQLDLADLELPPSFPSPSSPSTLIQRDCYVQLTHETDSLRLQNTTMAAEVRRRDQFAITVESLVHDVRQGDPEADNDRINQGSSDRISPFAVQFTPLTLDEGRECVQQTLQSIANARLLYASEASFQNRPTFLGWSQYARRQSATFTFAVKKSLLKVTPGQLVETTWRLARDKKLTGLGPSYLHANVQLLQKMSDDVMILDRRTEDYSHLGLDGQPAAVRTIYVLFRMKDVDGSWTVAMKTIALPLVKKLLLQDETWCDIFYWMRYSPDGSANASHGSIEIKEERTAAEFGGANTYTREDFASSPDRLGMFPLDWAELHGHLEVLKWLHVNRHEESSLGYALAFTARNGHLELVVFCPRMNIQRRQRRGDCRL
ncbi:hypothetical protein BBJ28_00012647 [Nothophytophthora sp. Chile5]|nr:hypothetical protein BBJ28_00012647 [Nothophytophthora sp. Chile5]